MSIRRQAYYLVAALTAFGVLAAAAWPAAAQATIEEAEARVADPFLQQTSFTFTTTLYVATNEPGASNTNNGRFPTYRGGTNGPFKDFTSSALVKALGAGKGLRVYVRAGIYGVPKGGLKVRGTGTATAPVMLAGYPGDERPVIDGGECLPAATLATIVAAGTYTPLVESLVRVDGRYAIVQDLQLQCGFRQNVLARGQHIIIRRNVLRGAYEDSIKSLRGADFGLIADNDMAGFASQAVDHFGAHHWLITRNAIHDPAPNPVTGAYDGNAITAKGTARNVIVTRNLVSYFPTTPNQSAITFGAPSSLDTVLRDVDGTVLPAAIGGVAMGNVVTEFTGAAFAVQSCDACTVAQNRVDRTIGVMKIGLSEDARLASDAAVLPYSTGTTVRDNAARFLVVDCSETMTVGQSCFATWVANSREAGGLVLTGNQYYSDTMPVFVGDDVPYTLYDFQAGGLEVDSVLLPLASWP